VREQIPNEYYDKLLGGIILTGGGSNLKNIEVAFRYHTRIDKIRTAKFVTLTINSGDSAIKAHDGMINTALGLLAKGYVNCAGGDLNTSRDLFSTEEEEEEVMDTDGQQTGKVEKPGVLAAEKARLEKERLEKERLEKEKQEKEAAAEAERKKKENSLWNRFSRKLKQFGEDIVKDE
jgi:cell division protein FtsA